jgi:hypothetical protein
VDIATEFKSDRIHKKSVRRTSLFHNVFYSRNDKAIMSLVECICLVNFHHTTGNVIEWVFPQKKEYADEVKFDITSRGMPDQSHKFAKDYCYFTTGQYYCVACMIFFIFYSNEAHYN